MVTKTSNSNSTLNKAKSAKQDEFYTQLGDISNELRHYKSQLRDKVVLCNCDDPFESNFFKYFALNFNTFGLKRLIATSYVRSPVAGQRLPLFEIEGLKPDGKEAYAIIINHVPDGNGDGAIDLSDVEYLLRNDANAAYQLHGNAGYGPGDFRSDECVDLLKQSDIVVTNPPFSLFREYIAQLIEHDKKFLLIGSQNAITYKEIFPLMKDDKLWLGVDNGGTKWFRVPDDYDHITTESRKKIENGIKYFSMGSIMWYTNMDNPKRHEEIALFRPYNPQDYPTYDNYDAIDVSKVADIPVDYDGVMGVPITFMDKYNPKQFKIVGITKTWFGMASKRYPNQIQFSTNGTTSEVSKLNDGPALKVESAPANKTYYQVGDDLFVQTYARVLITRRK